MNRIFFRFTIEWQSTFEFSRKLEEKTPRFFFDKSERNWGAICKKNLEEMQKEHVNYLWIEFDGKIQMLIEFSCTSDAALRKKLQCAYDKIRLFEFDVNFESVRMLPQTFLV